MAEKKSINLVISNNQYSEKLIPSGQTYKRVLILEDNIEVTTEGFLYNKGKSMYITYDEVADGGLENTKTIVKLEGEDKLQIRRYGKDDGAGMMDMCLEATVPVRTLIPGYAAQELSDGLHNLYLLFPYGLLFGTRGGGHYIYYFRLAITCLISILSLLEKRKIFFAFLLLLISLSLRERLYEPICLYFSCHQSCRSFSHQQIRKGKTTKTPTRATVKG